MRNSLKLQRFISLIGIFALISTALVGAAPAAPAASATTRVIVQASSLDQAAAAVTANGGQVTSNIDIINAVVANIPQANLAQLSSAPGVMHVTLDREVRTNGTLNDNDDGRGVEFQFPKVIGADQVWAAGDLGENVTVAFLDSGIDSTFEDLHKGPGPGNGGERYLAYYDAINKQLYTPQTMRSGPQDPNGHGTHVAGIVGNSSQADGLYRGIAPAVNLVAVRALGENGVGTYADVLEGINWIVQHKDTYNIRVLNVSMYATPVSPYWADPADLAVMAAWKAGIVVVASAGNGGPAPMTIGVPGNTPYIITAGAFSDNHTPADLGDDYMPPFSAAGPTLDAFVKPDVIAPGAHVASVMRNSSELARTYPDNRIGGRYFQMSGTSMSSAMVTGIVALMLSKHPELTPDQVKYKLTITARPQFSEVSGQSAYSIWQEGAGRVWAPDAVLGPETGSANQGMDLNADLAGTTHYEGFSFYDDASGQFRIRGDGYNSWSGGYNSWSGGYNSWSGGYNSWSGGTTNWSGGFNSWSGGYNSWSGGYNSWSGGYNSWSGGYNSWGGGYNSWSGGYNTWSGGYTSWSGGYNTWSGGYGSWSGGYGSWSGGYGSWSGGYGSWSGGYSSWAGGYGSWSGSMADPSWAAAYLNLTNLPTATSSLSINILP